MASLTRSKKATYTIHEKVTVNTSDREEHTFCGIMFPVQCKEILPLDHIIITSISVRGGLGPLTVWVTKDNDDNTTTTNNVLDTNPSKWHKVYDQTHRPNFRNFVSLNLDKPILLKPGEIKGVYVHSTLPGDQAIVYDNHYGSMNKSDTPEDSIVKIHSALSHVSEQPFGSIPIWGWGNAWRTNRKFVGRISYGIIYKLWHPKHTTIFGNNFQNLVHVLLCCQRRLESPVSKLPDDCIYYILHLCKWDWMDDNYNTMEYNFLNRFMALEQQHQEEQDRNNHTLSSSENFNNDNIADATHYMNDDNDDDDNDDEWEDDDDDDDDDEDEDFYENWNNQLEDNHSRRMHEPQSLHTILFDSNTIQNEYKEKYYSNHTTTATNTNTTSDSNNERQCDGSVRNNRLYNRLTRNNHNPIGIHYFTMMRGGSATIGNSSGVTTRSITNRRRTHASAEHDNDTTGESGSSSNNQA